LQTALPRLARRLPHWRLLLGSEAYRPKSKLLATTECHFCRGH
jgi:hypothetical protein